MTACRCPAKYVPHFKAGKELRERVDGEERFDSGDAGAFRRLNSLRETAAPCAAFFSTLSPGRSLPYNADCYRSDAGGANDDCWRGSSSSGFFLLVLWFALKNTTPVPVHFTARTSAGSNVPLIVVMLACIAIGALLGALALALADLPHAA